MTERDRQWPPGEEALAAREEFQYAAAMKTRGFSFLLVAALLTACGGDDESAEGDRPQSIGACAVLPADNAWNTDISGAPVDPRSDAYIASIGLDTGLHPDFGTIYGIPYVAVDGSVTKTTVTFDYADESDPGPYPIPADPPIEEGGDRHILMVHTEECTLYELFAAERQGDGWHAGSGAIFDLASNDLRPDGWTSADAAGLPILPGLARWDEAVEKGAIHHALRFTASSTQSAYAHPARHSAGDGADPDLPPMGLRVRLKAGVDISAYPPQTRAVLTALKRYGMILADNGSNWYVTGAPDLRWDDDDLHSIGDIRGSDFEAVATGPLTPGF